MGPYFFFVASFIEFTAFKRLKLLLVAVLPSYFIKMAYPSVGVLQASNQLGEPSLHGHDP